MPHAIARACLLALALTVTIRGAGAQAGTSPAPSTPVRTVAVTVDDLPFVSRRFAATADQRAMTVRLLAAMRAHGVPAVGFVNEGKLRRRGAVDAGQVGLLRLWLDAGLELGNHTYSHLDLHRVPADSFVQEVVRGDSVTRSLLAPGRPPRWFRHPLLHTGRSVAARATVDSALAARGYAVAPVTLDNYDYLFAAAYDDALGRRDSAAVERLSAAYLAYMEQVVAYYEVQSVRILGREIPQVLLLHANALNADTFDALARMLRARGYAFAPLERVLADSAYRSPDTYV